MKIRIVQRGFYAGRIYDNFTAICAEYKKALSDGADLMVLPEDAICGYNAGILVQNGHYVEQCISAMEKLKKEAGNCAILGEISGNFFLIEKEKITYIEDDFVFKKYSCKIVSARPAGSKSNADITFILDALPFVLNYNFFNNILEAFADTSLVYVNQCGGKDNVVLCGHSMLKGFNDRGVHIFPDFEEACHTFEWNKQKFSPLLSSKFKPYKEPVRDVQLIHDALVVGIRDYFKHAGVKKAVVGLSGGIDSAVVLSLAVQALGRKNVFGVMMPSQFSTDHSVKDAVQLADNWQIYYEIIKIKPIYDIFIKQLAPISKNTKFCLAEENLQARVRSVLLMYVANKQGCLLINTSNKSEGFCGYGTLYGDLCGSISPLGDLYKSQVYKLAEYINRKKEMIPPNTINKAPSAELHEGQKDSDSLGEYNTIEAIAVSYLKEGLNAGKISKRIGAPKAETEKILRLFRSSEFKRRQAAPAIILSDTPLCHCGLPVNG
jgi:NAD+ synthase (glutamine-hydrolysing)